VSDAHLAWTHAGVAVSGTFICLYEVGYVKTDAGEVRFSTPADLRRQLMGVAPADGDHDYVPGAAGRPEDVPGDHLVMRELTEAGLTFVVGSVLIVLSVSFFLAAS
jgi:hypothetical protein